MALPADEEIVRAICTDKWDGQRVSPSAFNGPDTSVSRLALASLDDHWSLFRAGVERPPERMLERIGQIRVGQLAELGRSHEPPAEIIVEPDPLDWNPAHAIIPGKRRRGLANRIAQAVVLHQPPLGLRR
jgi:hypothetical protein